jgi:hypothetical protein
MSSNDKLRHRGTIAQFISPAALEPQKRPTRTLWLGATSSTLSGMVPGIESQIGPDIGKPVRVTMFKALPFVKAAFPRHVPWSLFPVISEPYFEFKAFVDGPRRSRNEMIYPDPGVGLVEVSDIVNQFDCFALAPEDFHGGPLRMNEELLKLGYTLECFAKPESTICVMAKGWGEPKKETTCLGGDKNHPIEWETERFHLTTTDKIMERVRPYGLFMYSYRINFAAIAMKALRAARTEAKKPSIIDHVAYVRNPRLNLGSKWKKPNHKHDSNHYWLIFEHVGSCWDALNHGRVPKGLDHPLALQILYALRKSGPVACEDYLNSWDGSGHLLGALLKNTRGGYNNETWAGTGKHPPMIFGCDKFVEASLLATGLIEIDHQNLTVSITDIGVKFLDYLHPSCEDPDVILRWLGEDGFFRPDSLASIEEWLTKFFRKMKTRVNEIPAELTEHRATDAKDLGWDDFED